MNILLVEDEDGIREGLATFLRLKGHVVRDAESCARGRALLASGGFDLLITDWRLGDGLGDGLVRDAGCPVVVMTGYPAEVTVASDRATVLRKPVTPAALLAEVERHSPARATGPSRRARSPVPDGLPRDTRDRLTLAIALAGCHPARAELLDDGDTVTLRMPLSRDEDRVLEQLEALGGDLRVLDRDGSPRVELRLYRDGRPEGAAVIGPGDPWPAGSDPLAVDLEAGPPCDPGAFAELAGRVERAGREGRTVHLLNIPPHLRLHLELVDTRHVLPKRPKSGPHLPEVLVELWRQG